MLTPADLRARRRAGAEDGSLTFLQFRAHEVWSLRMGTSLEDCPRYTPNTCFETFSLP